MSKDADRYEDGEDHYDATPDLGAVRDPNAYWRRRLAVPRRQPRGRADRSDGQGVDGGARSPGDAPVGGVWQPVAGPNAEEDGGADRRRHGVGQAVGQAVGQQRG
jgi:hypothetical protein